jgi:adenylosuccinate synthase
MAYTLADLLAAEEVLRRAVGEADGSDRGGPGRVMRSMRRAKEAADAEHRPLVDKIRADLEQRADPEYLAHKAAQETTRRAAHEKEEAARAERKRIQDTLHALYPVPKRGARYVFEGKTYVRRASQFPGGRSTYFKQVPSR